MVFDDEEAIPLAVVKSMGRVSRGQAKDSGKRELWGYNSDEDYPLCLRLRLPHLHQTFA